VCLIARDDPQGSRIPRVRAGTGHTAAGSPARAWAVACGDNRLTDTWDGGCGMLVACASATLLAGRGRTPGHPDVQTSRRSMACLICSVCVRQIAPIGVLAALLTSPSLSRKIRVRTPEHAEAGPLNLVRRCCRDCVGPPPPARLPSGSLNAQTFRRPAARTVAAGRCPRCRTTMKCSASSRSGGRSDVWVPEPPTL